MFNSLKFEITKEQWSKAFDFCQEQDEIWAKKHEDPLMPGRPYYGAIGGGQTISFTPTSLGTVVKIRHATGAEIDVTDYENW